ncbi:MAG: cytochrome ubiquinol oxidase subunit I [Ardenticatenaceae bacterium]|nr:cytochrome ubiquinol oxidase subunit I [Ardenticatenaceae bacterium]
MNDFLFARSQMALSLAFHIIFAAIGIGMPLLMVISEGLYLRTRDEVYLTLTKRWASGTAILFAVGAVSGTVLSFELGLLWPKFMAYAGSIIGMPFSLEGFAFFAEAIFLGIYLYGWNRIPPKVHWLAGLLVLFSGTISGIFVVTANAWMNTPTGFDLVDGVAVNIRPFAAMFNPATFSETLHMTVAAFQSVGFLVAGIHAFMLLRDPHNQFHRRALAIALVVATIFSVAQPLVGDHSAKHVAEYQPIKLAALEGQWETETGAPLRIGGLPNAKTETTPYALEIPKGLSFLAYGNFNAEVMGLKAVPPVDRPPVAIVHVAFQIMVVLGMTMMGVGLLGGWLAWRKKHLPDQRWYLWLVIACAPMGMAAIEAGWVVTEVGRQPWTIYNLLRTADAVTPVTGLVAPFVLFTLLYVVLGVVTAVLLQRQVFASPVISNR